MERKYKTLVTLPTHLAAMAQNACHKIIPWGSCFSNLFALFRGSLSPRNNTVRFFAQYKPYTSVCCKDDVLDIHAAVPSRMGRRILRRRGGSDFLKMMK